MTENALFMRRKYLGPECFRFKKFWTQKFFKPKNFVGSKKNFDTIFFCFLLINKAFSVISNWIYSPFNNLTFAQPYLEQTFTWNSSVAQLSPACFHFFFMKGYYFCRNNLFVGQLFWRLFLQT